jgi:hypothetical protein
MSSCERVADQEPRRMVGSVLKPEQQEACKRAYVLAYEIQDACNLSGVTKSIANQGYEGAWIEARAFGMGTDYLNKHPVAVLYWSKCLDLSRQGGDLPFLDAAMDAVMLAKDMPAEWFGTAEHGIMVRAYDGKTQRIVLDARERSDVFP